MTLDQLTRDDRTMVRRYDYGDAAVVAVDFGGAADASVDVADGTVIVVLEDDQYEFSVPDTATDAQAFIRNGVLTLELEEDA